jgi:hypothetical protein
MDNVLKVVVSKWAFTIAFVAFLWANVILAPNMGGVISVSFFTLTLFVICWKSETIITFLKTHYAEAEEAPAVVLSNEPRRANSLLPLKRALLEKMKQSGYPEPIWVRELGSMWPPRFTEVTLYVPNRWSFLEVQDSGKDQEICITMLLHWSNGRNMTSCPVEAGKREGVHSLGMIFPYTRRFNFEKEEWVNTPLAQIQQYMNQEFNSF